MSYFRKARILVIGGYAAIVLVSAACATGSRVASQPDSPTGVNVSTTPDPGVKPVPVLSLSQITLKLKVKDKECFGEAGCNVTVQVQAGWPEEDVASGDEYEVTYAISGVEDGPQIGTFTIHDDGTLSTQDEFLSTKSSKSKLTIKATDIEKQL